MNRSISQVFEWAPDTTTDVTCIICGNNFERQFGDFSHSTVKRLPCNHEFHKHCIDEWFTRKRICPLCKGQ